LRKVPHGIKSHYRYKAIASMRVAVKFAYYGKRFYGYARQPNLKTVEGEIIKTCFEKKIFREIKEARIRSSSRTDKGVSALCNIIAFNSIKDIDEIIPSITSNLTDIIPYGIAEIDEDFNIRYAKLRHYRYYLPKEDRDVDRIKENANLFIGIHDFTNFARIEDNKNPVREIRDIYVSEDKDFIIFDFYAQTFLWHQIRRIISAIIKMEKGTISKKDIMAAFEKPHIRIDYGVAPAEPLILMDIQYDNLSFKIYSKLYEECRDIEYKVRAGSKYLSF